MHRASSNGTLLSLKVREQEDATVNVREQDDDALFIGGISVRRRGGRSPSRWLNQLTMYQCVIASSAATA